jgi:hypothetical protein
MCNTPVQNNDPDLRDDVVFWGGLVVAILGTIFIIFSIFQKEEFMSRMWMAFGIGLYFLGISLLISASFSHKKAFNILRKEIRALSLKATPNLDSNEALKKTNLSNSNDIDEICNDYSKLLAQLTSKEESYKNLRENTDKLNTAILFQLLKFHKDNEQGNRDFAYSNLYLMMVTFLFSLAAVLISVGMDKVWVLAISIGAMIIAGFLIKYWYRTRLEGQ